MRKGLMIGLCSVLLAACVLRDSPAPGCRRTIGLGMGGCAGKTAILDLTVEPLLECLQIEANNCNGGVLTVHNRCAEALTLGGAVVAAGERETLDIVESDGGWALMPTAGNFALTIPANDAAVEIGGELGGQAITVRFTKTAPLCE